MAKRRSKQKNSTIFLSAFVFLVFVFMYLVTPQIYAKVKASKYESKQNQLISTLTAGNDTEMLITRYAIENNAYVKVQSEDQTKHFETPVISSISYTKKTQTFNLNDGTKMNLEVQYANHDMIVLNRVLMIVLPVFGIILILLIQLFNYLGKGSGKDDFEQFKKQTDAMLQLKPNVKLPTNDSNQTKNALARNINDLYGILLNSTHTFKKKMKENENLEKQTIDALKQASQQAEQPIEEIKMILNGLILNEGKFQNQRSYLIEAKMKLEDLQTNLNQQLMTKDKKDAHLPINIQDFFKRLFQPYELICLEKRVRIRYKFTKSFNTTMNEFLFSKAFRNLMDFTIAQCQSQSNIVVSQNNYDIIIAYKGAALTDASIKRIKENDINIKALFETIQSIGFFIDFETTPKKDGMQFVFHF